MRGQRGIPIEQANAHRSEKNDMRKKVAIIGSNFAGLTAAVELKKRLGEDHDVLVLSKDERFLFMPSLIWLPFGLRSPEDVTFPLAPIYKSKGIDFKVAKVDKIDLQNQKLFSTDGVVDFDYLVIATGPTNNFSAIPGFGPHEGYTQSIFGLSDALKAKESLEQFWKNPGPVVIGAVQGAGCFGAAYEFLLNFNYQLKKRNLRDKISVTYVTAEPYLGHFGIGGFGNGRAMIEKFFEHENIHGIPNVAVKEVKPMPCSLRRSWVFRRFATVRKSLILPDLSRFWIPIKLRNIPMSTRLASASHLHRPKKPQFPAEFRKPGTSPKKWQRSSLTISPRRFRAPLSFSFPPA
jgi:hypothetical protein